MSLDSDFVLIGTGVGPLVAARRLMERGHRVLLLNPDVDYFIENAELPLDLLLPEHLATLTPERLRRSLVSEAFALLSPEFPGPVTIDSQEFGSLGVRSRQRFWVQSPAHEEIDWERWYLQLSEWGLKPEIHDPHWVPQRFPGYSAPVPPAGKALSIPKMADVPLDLFRGALLEFVRERAGPGRVICGASQIQLMPYGVRFVGPQGAQSALMGRGLWVFWTPRLEHWIKGLMQTKRLPAIEPPPWLPVEEWSLLSRKHTVADVVGQFEDALIWSQDAQLIKVLRVGSSESHLAISKLTHHFLGWDRVTVRHLRRRFVYDWEHGRVPAPLKLAHGDLQSYVLTHMDGPLTEIIFRTREFVEAHA